jgi:hypothetical protein
MEAPLMANYVRGAIGFSIPDMYVNLASEKSRLMAAAVPGQPYAHAKYSDYLEDYRRAWYGLTWKKAGWDCYRHYEILGCGCIPYFIGLAKAPGKVMPEIPRWLDPTSERMLAAWDNTAARREVAEELRDAVVPRLTSSAVAKALLSRCGLSDVQRIKYVRPLGGDYLSDLTLIGMKSLLGSNCVETPSPAWLYSDSADDISHWHGRGFGYGKSIPPKDRPTSTGSYDAYIFGSFTRNREGYEEAIAEVGASSVIKLYGEDWPCDDDGRTHCFHREWAS